MDGYILHLLKDGDPIECTHPNNQMMTSQPNNQQQQQQQQPTKKTLNFTLEESVQVYTRQLVSCACTEVLKT